METIYAFLFDLIGNDIFNITYLFIAFAILAVLLVITIRPTGGISAFLLIPLVILYLGVNSYAVKFTLKSAAIETRTYAESYIDSIKQETAAEKDLITVDTTIIGKAGRTYLIEFEKYMAEKNYKSQSNNNGIVVYKKL